MDVTAPPSLPFCHLSALSLMNILIVVETYFVARILRERLEDMGYSEIMLATSAPEAVQHLRVSNVDLIVVDAEWLKPGIDIHSFLTSIRKSDVVKSIPILMCSSKNKAEDIKIASKAGASGYLLKPYTEESLKQQIDKILMNDVELQDTDSEMEEELEAVAA